MGLTGCKSGLFRAPGFIVSPVGKEEKKEKGNKGKRNRKGKEGRKEGSKEKKIGGKKEEGIFTKIKIKNK